MKKEKPLPFYLPRTLPITFCFLHHNIYFDCSLFPRGATFKRKQCLPWWREEDLNNTDNTDHTDHTTDNTGDTDHTDITDYTDKRKRSLRWWKREDMDKMYVTRMG